MYVCHKYTNDIHIKSLYVKIRKYLLNNTNMLGATRVT